jgi:hypothetical protein
VLDISSAGPLRTHNDGARLGIARSYPRPLSGLRGFGDTPAVLNPGATFEGASLLARRLMTLPTHSKLSRRDLVKLGEWICRRGQGREAADGSGAKEYLEAEVRR